MANEIPRELIDQILSLKEEGMSRNKISRIVGVAESTIRGWEKQGKLAPGTKPIASGTLIRPHNKRAQLKGKTFLFTSAQNNTFVFKEFLDSLKVCQQWYDAQLHIGCFSYNKNGFQNGVKETSWYDPLLSPYLLDDSCQVFEDLIWCGELNILPTAATPLSGFSNYCRGQSGIIPHAKVQLKSLPRRKTQERCPMLYTTGAVTKANYIQKTAGQKADNHHVFGAVIAEVDEDGDWFVRQLIADSRTGCFYDLDTLFTPEGAFPNQNVEAINHGDLHSEKPEVHVYHETFKEGGMLDQLKPKHQFMNDTMDFPTRNHHRIKDPYHRYKMQIEANGRDTVEGDILKAVEVLKRAERPWCKTVVVESNHDLAIMRWLKESDPKTDNIWNALFYHEAQLEYLRQIKAGTEEEFSLFEWAVRRTGVPLDAVFLKEDESFVICPDKEGKDGIECGSHGHLGNNGARGSVQAYRIIGVRHNIGHGHAATILDGVYMAGIKGSLEQGYNKGGSTWSLSDIITYPSSKRTIVTWINGKFRVNRGKG